MLSNKRTNKLKLLMDTNEQRRAKDEQKRSKRGAAEVDLTRSAEEGQMNRECERVLFLATSLTPLDVALSVTGLSSGGFRNSFGFLDVAL